MTNLDNWHEPWTWQDQEVFEYLVKHKFSSVTIQKLMRRPISTIYRKRKELRDGVHTKRSQKDHRQS